MGRINLQNLLDLDPIQYMVPCVNLNQPQNGISIGSAAFAGLMNVTNRQTDTHTDHATPRL